MIAESDVRDAVLDVRELTEVECAHRCDIGVDTGHAPLDQLSIIKHNSTYIELIDSRHNWRGILSIIALLPLGFIFGTIPSFVWMTITGWERHSQHLVEVTGVFVVLFLVNIPIFLLARWMLKTEGYQVSYTSIRFNRKLKKVYIIDRDGGVSTAPWEGVFITATPSSVVNETFDLKCLLISADQKYVWSEFEFNFSGSRPRVLGLWEYIRKYMENGPENALPSSFYCLPVLNKMEPPIYSFCRIMLNFDHFGRLGKTLLSPWVLLLTLGRILANSVSHPPKWPDFVDAECDIEPGDPWERDHRTNPPYLPGIFSVIKT